MVGIEPTSPKGLRFECSAYTNSTTSAKLIAADRLPTTNPGSFLGLSASVVTEGRIALRYPGWLLRLAQVVSRRVYACCKLGADGEISTLMPGGAGF